MNNWIKYKMCWCLLFRIEIYSFIWLPVWRNASHISHTPSLCINFIFYWRVIAFQAFQALHSFFTEQTKDRFNKTKCAIRFTELFPFRQALSKNSFVIHTLLSLCLHLMCVSSCFLDNHLLCPYNSGYHQLKSCLPLSHSTHTIQVVICTWSSVCYFSLFDFLNKYFSFFVFILSRII